MSAEQAMTAGEAAWRAFLTGDPKEAHKERWDRVAKAAVSHSAGQAGVPDSQAVREAALATQEWLMNKPKGDFKHLRTLVLAALRTPPASGSDDSGERG